MKVFLGMLISVLFISVSWAQSHPEIGDRIIYQNRAYTIDGYALDIAGPVYVIAIRDAKPGEPAQAYYLPFLAHEPYPEPGDVAQAVNNEYSRERPFLGRVIAINRNKILLRRKDVTQSFYRNEIQRVAKGPLRFNTLFLFRQLTGIDNNPMRLHLTQWEMKAMRAEATVGNFEREGKLIRFTSKDLQDRQEREVKSQSPILQDRPPVAPVVKVEEKDPEEDIVRIQDLHRNDSIFLVVKNDGSVAIAREVQRKFQVLAWVANKSFLAAADIEDATSVTGRLDRFYLRHEGRKIPYSVSELIEKNRGKSLNLAAASYLCEDLF